MGAGKSALARALLGLYPLEAGQVRLGGRALEDVPVASASAWHWPEPWLLAAR